MLDCLAMVHICAVPGTNHMGLTKCNYSLICKLKQLLHGQQYANREDTLIAL